MEEIWKPVPTEYCNFKVDKKHWKYEASNTGLIKMNTYINKGGRTEHEKTLKPFRTTRGYLKVKLIDQNGNRFNCCIHRLVATVFIPNPENLPQINHKDGNKENNHVKNLEWCTGIYNQWHKYAFGLANNCGEVLEIRQYSKDGNIILDYQSAKEAFRQTQINDSQILDCCKRKYGAKTAGGYLWRYCCDDELKDLSIKERKAAIETFLKKTNTPDKIKEWRENTPRGFQTRARCARELGLAKSTVGKYWNE